MSKHDDTVSLRQMLDHAAEPISTLGQTSRDDFIKNRILQLAIARLIEILGEAAYRITLQTREAYADIPWPQIIGMRNRLIHGYDSINLDLLWNTIKNDLPPLVTA